MNLILYMPEFARLPVVSVLLLVLAVVLSAVPGRKKLFGIVALFSVTVAVTVALLADGDKLLLAAALLMSAGAVLALHNGRRNKA